MKPDEPTVTAQRIPNAPDIVGNTEIVGLNYDLYNLTIGLADEDRNSILVVFQKVHGFRLLDERDLQEFWPVCSKSVGWALRIIKGGWCDHEKRGSGVSSQAAMTLSASWRQMSHSLHAKREQS